jgi:hypothetical protein
MNQKKLRCSENLTKNVSLCERFNQFLVKIIIKSPQNLNYGCENEKVSYYITEELFL